MKRWWIAEAVQQAWVLPFLLVWSLGAVSSASTRVVGSADRRAAKMVPVRAVESLSLQAVAAVRAVRAAGLSSPHRAVAQSDRIEASHSQGSS